MALPELNGSGIHVPRRRATTFEKAMYDIDESWVAWYETNAIPIQDILAGHVWISMFGESSQLEIIIN